MSHGDDRYFFYDSFQAPGDADRTRGVPTSNPAAATAEALRLLTDRTADVSR